MECLLCKEKEANQTGAHIFTNSLVKSCLNVEGKTGRDDELIFSFCNSGERDLYVGKTTSVAKIEEVLGRPITNEELKTNSNKIVIDNIYCTDCEKLFGKIESPFTDRILKKIRDRNIYEFKSPDNILIRLYFYIQIWRASSYKFEGWQLHNKELEEHLRQLIFDSCNLYENGLPIELQEALLKFPLVVNYLETPEGEKSTNLFLIGKKIAPYYFFLCDFIVEFMPINDDNVEINLAHYYGVNDGIKSIEVNRNEEKFIIRVISNNKRNEIKALIVSELAVFESERLKEKFIKTYEELTGIVISQEKLNHFKNAFFDFEEVPIAQRWSEDRFNRILNDVIGTPL